MVTTATSAPARAVPWRLSRPAIAAAGAACALYTALGAVQLAAPAQPSGAHHFVRTSDYVIEILFAASLLGTASAATLLGRYHRAVGQWNTAGIIAVAGYALGPGLAAISAAATAARGAESLDIIQLPAMGIWLLAGLLMAIATVRARVLPIAICLGFAAGLPAAMALGTAGPLALALLWAATAAALAANKTRRSQPVAQGTERPDRSGTAR